VKLERPSWQTVDVDGTAIRVMTAGTGDPLLFLHGWGLSPRTYSAGITRLTAAGLQVIAPALPGFGGSAGPALRSIDMGTYGQLLGRLLDAMGIEHPAFVVGHSFGGGVAISLATQRPERVRSQTLLNSVGGALDQHVRVRCAVPQRVAGRDVQVDERVAHARTGPAQPEASRSW
jgi:pimeloyl-ACP methyl ester carboxylesterase